PGVAVRRRHLPRAAYPAAVDDHRHATLKTRTRPRIEPHYTTPSPRLAGRSAQSAGTPSSENADVGPPHYTPVSRPRPRRGSRAADGARNEVPRQRAAPEARRSRARVQRARSGAVRNDRVAGPRARRARAARLRRSFARVEACADPRPGAAEDRSD